MRRRIEVYHQSHNIPPLKITPCNEHFMGKLAEYAFSNSCLNCGGRIWGTNLSFDYDAKLAKPCKATKRRNRNDI